MDVFSWFRQKREGRRPAPFDEIHVPLKATPACGLVVYYRRPDGETSLPDIAELLQSAYRWTDAHSSEPMRSAIREFIESGFLQVFVHERQEMPEPPDDVLRAYNPGEIEERRFRNATHAIVIAASDWLARPRIGLWSVVAAARGIASALPAAVVVDPEFPRLLTLESLSKDITAEGRVFMPDHILIPYSTDESTGLLWITTKGMSRFGLPEIEICDAPPNLIGSLMPVVNGLAQRLVNTSMVLVDAVGSGGKEPEILSLPSELQFGIDDIRAAYTPIDEYPARSSGEITPRSGANARAATIRLEMGGRRANQLQGCIRLTQPRSRRDETGVWLNRLLDSLLGSNPQIESVETNNRAMEFAHQKAMKTLDQIRVRFGRGFRSGEVLHVKHGFPTDSTGREYMWIAVTSWQDNRISGNIANDPQLRHDLRAGQRVEILEADVYDWMIAHTDGRLEGAWTNRVLNRTDERTSFDTSKTEPNIWDTNSE